MEFDIIFYEENGKFPVVDFLNSLTIAERDKMSYGISLLKRKGNQMKMPYSEPIEDRIFCLRAKANKKHMRILYFFYHHGRIILTNGFIKKTNKTPKKEIAIAKERMKKYIERRRHDI